MRGIEGARVQKLYEELVKNLEKEPEDKALNKYEEEIAKGKFVALMASRTNTLLSIPMLLCMTGYGHGLAV